MAADVTETRPDLYHALLADGFAFTPLQGGGGVFRREVHDRLAVAVHLKRGRGAELWVNARTQVARFVPATADAVIAAAAIAQTKETSQ